MSGEWMTSVAIDDEYFDVPLPVERTLQYRQNRITQLEAENARLREAVNALNGLCWDIHENITTFSKYIESLCVKADEIAKYALERK